MSAEESWTPDDAVLRALDENFAPGAGQAALAGVRLAQRTIAQLDNPS